MLNRACIIGRLTKDPETRVTTTGKTVATFTLAVAKRIKPTDPNEPDAYFFRVTAWNQSADYISSYGGKGRMVSVDGRLEQRRYTDSQGQQREVVEIVADALALLDRPRDDAAATPQPTRRPDPNDEYDPFADE